MLNFYKKINIIQVISFIIGFVLTINGLLLFLRTNFNLGNALTLILGLVFVIYSKYFDWINKKLPKWIKSFFVLGLIIALFFTSFLFVYGLNDNVQYNEDAIIVLGAAVQGDIPSRSLADRLNTAIKYHKENPEAVIVVSGGKGPQENVTEAYAMEQFLIKNGVSKDKIIKEEKATSTYENFLYSKEILDKNLEAGYKVSFVSNEYHIYRARGIAKKIGLTNVTHIHSNTVWHSVVTGTLRECLAVVKFWVLGR
jgi:uncharacterized SAM-binding protein YcdF (DUF218 family)